MSNLSGIAASNGIAIAKAYKLAVPDLSFEKQTVQDTDNEINRLTEALEISKTELEKIKEHARASLGEEHAEIFSAHLLVLSDPELINPIKDKISTDQVNAEFALDETAQMFIQMFESMDNEYMRERAADIKDVTKRVMAHLLNVSFPNPALINEEVIVIAEDLTPSDTAQLNKQFVKGFTTNIGGRTSHSAIMARSLEIPAVVGTKEITTQAAAGDILIIDGIDGEVIINPSNDEMEKYEKKQADFEKQKEEWAKLKDEPTVSSDGHTLSLLLTLVHLKMWRV